MASTLAPGAVDLYWIPLGAGGHVVRGNGKLYEAITAFIEHRPRFALYHTALEVEVPDGRFVIESAPIRDQRGRERGVVVEGPVGTRWPDGSGCFATRSAGGAEVPSPTRAKRSRASPRRERSRSRQRVLDLVPSVPTPVRGRDELGTGDMWNSNSLISWLLVRAGVDTEQIQPPSGGRAPGWDAGIVVARRE
jgi:hypothetical protein